MDTSMAGSTGQLTPPPASAVESAEWLRCRGCSHRLMKITRAGLKPGSVLEVKCNSCKTLNYLIGTTE